MTVNPATGSAPADPTLRLDARATGPSAARRAARWEAVVIAPGLTLNRDRIAASVLCAAVPLFVGAPVRMATTYPRQHGGAEVQLTTARAAAVDSDGRLERYRQSRIAELLACIDTGSQLETLWRQRPNREPTPVGSIAAAEWDPYRGVVAEIDLADVTVDGLFVDLGLVHADETVAAAALRLGREGRVHLLGLSGDFVVKAHEGLDYDGLAASIVERFIEVLAIDICIDVACPTARFIGAV